MKKVIIGVGVIAGALLMTGCSSVSTASDQVALHYNGGSFSSKKFADCVPAATKKYNGPGDTYYYYPTSQRVYDATGGDGAESGAFTVVSKDNAEMRVPVTVTFQLKTDCDTLRKFHEELGNRYAAYMDGDNASQGWVTMLNVVMGKPLDTALDRIAQQYNWRDLWNNPEVKTAMEKQVNESMTALVNRQAGGDYFDNFSALIQKPDPVNNDLKLAVSNEQAAVAQSNSARAQAEAQKAAAEAQIAVSKAEAAKKAAEIDGYGGIESYLRALAIEKGINPWQPSYGSAIVNK